MIAAVDARAAAIRRATAAIGLVGLIVAPGVARAQEMIASDRPGIGSGSFVLRPGTFQLETGLEVAGFDAGNAFSLGQAFLRAGAGPVEIELALASYVFNDIDLPGLPDPEIDGFQSVSIGIKTPLARGVGGRMDLSLQGLLAVPSGSGPYESDSWSPTFNLLADIALAPRGSLAVNAGYTVALVGAAERPA